MKMEEMLEQLTILGQLEMEENFGAFTERDEMRTDLDELKLWKDTKFLFAEYKKTLK